MSGGTCQLASSPLGQQLACNQVLTVVAPALKLQNLALCLHCYSLNIINQLYCYWRPTYFPFSWNLIFQRCLED